jgi:hypothetical protein
MIHPSTCFHGWRVNGAMLLVLFMQPRLASAQTRDSLFAAARAVNAQPRLSFQLSSGIGCSPTNVGDLLWTVQILFGTPVFHNGMLWAGIIPTMVPQNFGDETAVDGFTPLVIEYEYDLGTSLPISPSAMPFLYANAGTGPQFGDRSNHRLFQAAMCSAGAGLRDGSISGFFGQLGITYNNIPARGSRAFLILNSGIFF